MLKRKKIIVFITVIFLLPMLLLCVAQMQKGIAPFCIYMESDGHTETIHLWEGDDGVSYAFLPSCGETARLRVHLNTSNPVYLDGQALTEGFSCDELIADRTYTLRYRSWGLEKEQSVVFLRSANVPALFLDTQSGSKDHIHSQKGNEEPGALRLYTEDGVLNYAGNLESVKGRGNATWTHREKKPYSLTFTENADLLGMGAAQRWLLLANAFDSSNLRNKIVYEFARRIGMPHSPDSEWVDVYLNGEYAGLYLLCERNEVHSERVAISETDSFLVSLELEERLSAQNYSYFTTEAKQALRIHYPYVTSEKHLSELAEEWQAIENALLATDGIDPVTGRSWEELIHLDSWARKYLIEEIFGSVDACMLSQYFYKDGADNQAVVYAGPVWDFDYAMGNRYNWELENPVSFQANHPHDRNGITAPWFCSLYQKEAFHERVVELYRSEFLPELNRLLEHGISEYAGQIQQASLMNERRWFENSSGFYEEVEYISAYMSARTDFFTDLWCENSEYVLVKADYGNDCWYAVVPGECFTDVYVFEDQKYADFLGWYYKDTNEPFDPTQPITEDIEIYAKWQPNESNKLKQMLKLAPLGVIAVIGVGLLWVEMKRWKKSR